MMPEECNVAGLYCSDVLARLSRYVDGELARDEVAQVDAHLAGCEWCERFGERFSATVVELRRRLHEPAPLPRDVASRLRDRLKPR